MNQSAIRGLEDKPGLLRRPYDCWVSLPNCVVGLKFNWVRRNVSSDIRYFHASPSSKQAADSTVSKKDGAIGQTNRSARMSRPSKCKAVVTFWSSSQRNGCWPSLPSLEDSFRCLGRPTNASSQLTIQMMQ